MVNIGMSLSGFVEAVDMFNDVADGFESGDGYVVAVGAEYGAYVELGTSTQEAQPYLFPAAREVMQSEFDRHEARASSMDDLTRRLALAIEREAKRKAPVDTGNLQNSIEAFPAGAQP